MTLGPEFENVFDFTETDVKYYAVQHIKDWLNQTNEIPDKFSLVSVELYGSQRNGIPTSASDIDIKACYIGSMREDDAFNGINDEGLSIIDKDGNTIRVDINPVRVPSNEY